MPTQRKADQLLRRRDTYFQLANVAKNARHSDTFCQTWALNGSVRGNPPTQPAPTTTRLPSPTHPAFSSFGPRAPQQLPMPSLSSATRFFLFFVCDGAHQAAQIAEQLRTYFICSGSSRRSTTTRTSIMLSLLPNSFFLAFGIFVKNGASSLV